MSTKRIAHRTLYPTYSNVSGSAAVVVLIRMANELRLFRIPKAPLAAAPLVTLPEEANLLGMKELPMEAPRITKRAVVGIFIVDLVVILKKDFFRKNMMLL